MLGFRLVLFLGLFMVLPATALGETVSVSASADTCLWELDPDFNFGAQTEVPAGTLGSMGNRLRSRALYRFDLAGQVPQQAAISSARLQVTVTRSPSDGAPSTFALHRVLKPWAEGSKSGDLPGGQPATQGESTWNARLQGDASWTEPGGMFGEDFATPVSGTTTISGNGNYILNLNETGLADLRTMLSNPSENHGWVLVTQSEATGKTAKRFGAREHPSAAPALKIDYEQESPPSNVDLEDVYFDRNTEEVVIRVTAKFGVSYVLQRASSESPQTWVTVAEEVGNMAGFLELRGSTRGFQTLFFRVSKDPP